MAVAADRSKQLARALILHEVDVNGLKGEARRSRISELAIRYLKSEDEYVGRKLKELREGPLYTFVAHQGTQCYVKRQGGVDCALLLLEADPQTKEEFSNQLQQPAVFIQALLDFEATQHPPYNGFSRVQRAEQLSHMLAIQERLGIEAAQIPPFQGMTRSERTIELSRL